MFNNKRILSKIYRLNKRRQVITTEKYQWNGLVKKLTSDSLARLLANGDTGVVSLYFLLEEKKHAQNSGQVFPEEQPQENFGRPGKDYLQKIYACSKNDFPFKYNIEKLLKYCRNDCQENDEFIPKQLRKEIQRKLQIAKKIDENSPLFHFNSRSDEINSVDGKSQKRKLKKSKCKNAQVVITDKMFLLEIIHETLNIDTEPFRLYSTDYSRRSILKYINFFRYYHRELKILGNLRDQKQSIS